MTDQLPPGWKMVSIDKIAKLRREPVHPDNAQNLIYVGLEHIDSGNPILRRWGNASEVRSMKNRFYPGDVLFGKLRPYLDKAVLVDKAGICSTDILVLQATELTTPDFLVNLVHSSRFLRYAVATTSGVNHPRTKWKTLRTLEIPLPPMPEQRAIARALRAVQAAREARQREVALERERKAALMDHLFTHGMRGEPTKQTPIGEMPQSWEVVELGSVCNVRYGLGQPPELDEDGVPMIRATDIKKGKIKNDAVLRVKREAIPDRRNPFLQKGDILVVRSGAYTGDVAMYDGRWELAVAGYDLVATPNQSVANSAFIASWLLGDITQRYFRSQRDRSAQPHLNARQLKSTLLPLPSLLEQKQIARVSLTCDAKIAALDREIALLDELFQALLEELMSGRVSARALMEGRS